MVVLGRWDVSSERGTPIAHLIPKSFETAYRVSKPNPPHTVEHEGSLNPVSGVLLDKQIWERRRPRPSSYARALSLSLSRSLYRSLPISLSRSLSRSLPIPLSRSLSLSFSFARALSLALSVNISPVTGAPLIFCLSS